MILGAEHCERVLPGGRRGHGRDGDGEGDRILREVLSFGNRGA